MLQQGALRLVYGEGTSSSPRDRLWNQVAGTWSDPTLAFATDTPVRWVVTPERLPDEQVVGVLTSNRHTADYLARLRRGPRRPERRKEPNGSFVYHGNVAAPPLGPGPIRLRPEVGSDRVVMAYVEYTCGGQTCDDVIGAGWDGIAWTNATHIDDCISAAYSAYPGAIPVDLAWIGGKVIAVYSDTGVGLDWATWSEISGWTLQGDELTSPALGQRVNIQAFSIAGYKEAMFLVADSIGDLLLISHDGNHWSALGAALGAHLSSNAAVPFAAAMKR